MQAGAEERHQIVTITPVFVEIPSSSSTFGHRVMLLDKTEPGEVPFPTESGTLTIRRKDDCFLVDRNGDGSLDELDGKPVTRNETFHVMANVAGKPINYPLRIVQVYPRAVYIEGRGALVGHNGKWLTLILDNNLDGIFGQVGLDHFKLTRFSKEKMRSLATSGDALFWTAGVAPLGKVVQMDGELYSVAVRNKGKTISFDTYEGERATLAVQADSCCELVQCEIGDVCLSIDEGAKAVSVVTSSDKKDGAKTKLADYSFLLAHDECTQFQRFGSGDIAVLVPGNYRMADLSLTFKFPTHKGSIWPRKSKTEDMLTAQLWGEADQRFKTIRIDAGENRLELGPPLRLACKAVVWGEKYDQFMVERAYLVGKGGETYRFQFSGGVKSSVQYYFSNGTKELFLGNLEPTQRGFDNSWRRIPPEIAENPESELILKFNAAGMSPIVLHRKLNELKQDHPPGRVMLGQIMTLLQQRRYEETAELCKEAARLHPDDARVQNDSAWYLLTMSSEKHRDPESALKFGSRAVELTAHRNGLMLDTYALALFETGQLEEAVSVQKQAVKWVPGNLELQNRLDEFQAALQAANQKTKD